MRRHSEETIGVRYTGWAALDRDPQDDTVDFVCPHCGQHGIKPTRRALGLYHFTDGFLQDTHGELATCKKCRQPLRITPVVLVHHQDEKRRFEAVFGTEANPLVN